MRVKHLGVLGLASVFGFIATGCDPITPVPDGQARVYSILESGAGQGTVVDKGGVPVADIESFIVTVTEISLDMTGEGDDDAEAGKVVVFSGAADVDLIALEEFSAVLAQAEVDAGTYSKVRLSIENPRMVLAADPDTTITDIQLTANGRLFVSGSFTLPDGQNVILALDMGGLHLVQQGNGGYTLTPQLDAEVTFLPADVVVQGTVQSIDLLTGEVVLAIDGGELVLGVNSAQIFRPEDVLVPTGTVNDLAVGATLEIRGALVVNGSIQAVVISILE